MRVKNFIGASMRANPATYFAANGPESMKTKLVCGTEAIELIYPPPETILTIWDFRGYQDWMARKMYELPGVFIAAGMGLGKTGASLDAMVRLLAEGKVRRFLVIAPMAVAENTWPDEIATWDFARDMDYVVATGTETQRIAAVMGDHDVTIINRENVQWLREFWGSKWPYDGLVYDEASRLKGAKKKTKAQKRADGTVGHSTKSEFGVLTEMTQIRNGIRKVILLSGTPAPNGLIDLWGPMYIIDKGKRLGSSRSKFELRWFRYDMNTRKHDPFDHSEREIMSSIKDVFFSLKAEDYLKLPPLIVNDRLVRLPPKAREIYNRFLRDAVLEEFDLEAVNGGVLTNKLLQLANGSLYLEDGSATHIHDAKLEALESIIAEAAGQPVLVGYSFKFDVEKIKKRFKHAVVFNDEADNYRKWNRGEIPLMLLHPGSAGHGLNFQHGGSIAVWYGLNWSLELYQQFNKRLHRPGQKAGRVMLHRIIARDTMDSKVARVLHGKDITQESITDAVRVYVEREQKAYGVAA